VRVATATLPEALKTWEGTTNACKYLSLPYCDPSCINWNLIPKDDVKRVIGWGIKAELWANTSLNLYVVSKASLFQSWILLGISYCLDNFSFEFVIFAEKTPTCLSFTFYLLICLGGYTELFSGCYVWNCA
jgi:hypothetical protein